MNEGLIWRLGRAWQGDCSEMRWFCVIECPQARKTGWAPGSQKGGRMLPTIGLVEIHHPFERVPQDLGGAVGRLMLGLTATAISAPNFGSSPGAKPVPAALALMSPLPGACPRWVVPQRSQGRGRSLAGAILPDGNPERQLPSAHRAKRCRLRRHCDFYHW